MMKPEQRDALRPSSLSDFTGQDDLVRHLSITLRAAKERNEMPDHVLLSGPPGLGKTTLAQIIAHEMGLPLINTSGPALERPGDAAALLSGISAASILFIDEIHRLPRQVEEILYPAMEDGVLDFVVGDGVKARTVRLPLQPLCVVGATTQSGMLSAPLRDRFGFQGRLVLYPDSQMSEIVSKSMAKLGVDSASDAWREIALRSRGTPRIANNLCRRVRDWAQIQECETIDGDVAREALAEFGIDDLGLDALGNDILRSLCTKFSGGPVGAATLAASVGEAVVTLTEVYEPYLMHRGMLRRTPRGRVATSEAYRHLGIDAPVGLTLELSLGLDESDT